MGLYFILLTSIRCYFTAFGTLIGHMTSCGSAALMDTDWKTQQAPTLPRIFGMIRRPLLRWPQVMKTVSPLRVAHFGNSSESREEEVLGRELIDLTSINLQCR